MNKEPLTIEKFKEIIGSREIELLIGYAENGFLDAKKIFYNLEDPKDKHELCKDITAFANNDGGYLLIGCETEKSQSEPVDRIKAAQGIIDFPNLDGTYSVLSEYIYPNSIGTFVKFKQIARGNGKKFLLAEIESKSEDKPYFVRKDAQNREFVAYYIRTHDRGTRQHIEYLHELTHQGIYFEKYLKNIAGINEKILDNSERLLKTGKAAQETQKRFNIKNEL